MLSTNTHESAWKGSSSAMPNACAHAYTRTHTHTSDIMTQQEKAQGREQSCDSVLQVAGLRKHSSLTNNRSLTQLVYANVIRLNGIVNRLNESLLINGLVSTGLV